MNKHKNPCEHCCYYVFTETLGSPDTPIWHCKYGFSYFVERTIAGNEYSCKTQALYNYKLEKGHQLRLF